MSEPKSEPENEDPEEKEEKLPPEIKLKIVVKVPRETHDRIVANAKECGVSQDLKKGIEENAYEWIEYIDGFLQGQADAKVGKSPLLGADGQPIGSG